MSVKFAPNPDSDYRFIYLDVQTYAREKRLAYLLFKYKETRKVEDFENLLLYCDELLMYFVKKCRMKYAYLSEVSGQECYDSAVIALIDVVNKVDSSVPVRLLPAYISAYVTAYLRKEFKCFERKGQVGVEVLREERDREKEERLNRPNFELLIDSCSEIEKKVLRSRFIYKKTLSEIAKECGCSIFKVHTIIKKGLKKVRKVLNLFSSIQRW